MARVIVPERNATSFGSGTLVDVRDRFGLVVTNWHVVRDASDKVEVVFPNGFRSFARPLKIDPNWDLAALVIWRPDIEPVPLAASAPRQGDTLKIAGYGQGTYRAATGRCTQYVAPAVNFPFEMVEVNVEARQGDSGGPIFNQRGELAGVLFGAGEGTTSGSYAGRVRGFLASVAPHLAQPAESQLAGNPSATRDEAPPLVASLPAQPSPQSQTSLPARASSSAAVEQQDNTMAADYPSMASEPLVEVGARRSGTLHGIDRSGSHSTHVGESEESAYDEQYPSRFADAALTPMLSQRQRGKDERENGKDERLGSRTADATWSSPSTPTRHLRRTSLTSSDSHSDLASSAKHSSETRNEATTFSRAATASPPEGSSGYETITWRELIGGTSHDQLTTLIAVLSAGGVFLIALSLAGGGRRRRRSDYRRRYRDDLAYAGRRRRRWW